MTLVSGRSFSHFQPCHATFEAKNPSQTNIFTWILILVLCEYLKDPFVKYYRACCNRLRTQDCACIMPKMKWTQIKGVILHFRLRMAMACKH